MAEPQVSPLCKQDDLLGAFGNQSFSYSLKKLEGTGKQRLSLRCNFKLGCNSAEQKCSVITVSRWNSWKRRHLTSVLHLSLACNSIQQYCWLYLLSTDCKGMNKLKLSVSLISAKSLTKNCSEYIDSIILSDVLFSNGNKGWLHTRLIEHECVVNVTHETCVIFSRLLYVVYWSPVTCQLKSSTNSCPFPLTVIHKSVAWRGNRGRKPQDVKWWKIRGKK